MICENKIVLSVILELEKIITLNTMLEGHDVGQ